MSTIRDITTMCKNGQIKEAYDLAKADLEEQFPGAQQELGWVLYYKIREDVNTSNFQSLLSNLDELNALDQLTIPKDNIIFENILFKVAMYVKSNVLPANIGTPSKLSALFAKLKNYSFDPSKGYSFLLQSFIKYDVWLEMADFIDWWDLKKLTKDDYIPFKTNEGKAIISVAERAYIAKSKALLRLNNFGRIEKFLPELDKLMNEYPQMTYPGYFYGKLLLLFGSTQEEELRVILPFARKKTSEFWVWQLLSDVFSKDPEKQLACLLRAVHCHAQESYLGRVRIKLAELYIQRNQYDLAKFHIEKVVQHYLLQRWRLPYEVECWIHQPWFNTAAPSARIPIDFKSITQEILCTGSIKAVAIVTHIATDTQKAILIYGKKKRMIQKLPFKPVIGTVLSINYIMEQDGRPCVLCAKRTSLSENTDYIKNANGSVQKRDDQEFAFLKTSKESFYIAPQTVRRFNLHNKDKINSLIVYDFNYKKETWGWTCISTENKNE